MEILLLAKVAAAFMLAAITLVFLVSKCFCLAPCRLGWLMMFANVVYETLYKKFHWRRWSIDAIALVDRHGRLDVGRVPVLRGDHGPDDGPGLGLDAAGGRAVADRRTRRQDSRHGIAAAPKQMPLPIPRLILIVRGPVLERGRILDLGDWPEEREDAFDLLILNPSTVVPQWPMTVRITASGEALQVVSDPSGERRAPEPGDFLSLPFRLRAGRAGTSGQVRVTLTHGDLVIEEVLRLRGVVPKDQARVTGAEIRRWKGGARAGFGWRGDQDLYDPATFQSAEGLRLALGLSRQFRLPSSLYLSGRLSLVPEEHRRFCEHFGFDRRTEGIPGFIEFLKTGSDAGTGTRVPVRDAPAPGHGTRQPHVPALRHPRRRR